MRRWSEPRPRAGRSSTVLRYDMAGTGGLLRPEPFTTTPNRWHRAGIRASRDDGTSAREYSPPTRPSIGHRTGHPADPFGPPAPRSRRPERIRRVTGPMTYAGSRWRGVLPRGGAVITAGADASPVPPVRRRRERLRAEETSGTRHVVPEDR